MEAESPSAVGAAGAEAARRAVAGEAVVPAVEAGAVVALLAEAGEAEEAPAVGGKKEAPFSGRLLIILLAVALQLDMSSGGPATAAT